MPRARRYIEAGQPYEIGFRARQGLPFTATLYMSLILSGIMARAQRDSKVILCHFIWMANHVHMLVVAKDAEQCKKFYEEIEKKITDSLKMLLGLDHLRLWEDRPMVCRIADMGAAIKFLRYLYLNPVAAQLVETIGQYPGLSSWDEYKGALNLLKASSSKDCPWIQLPMIPALPRRAVSERQDRFITENMVKSSKRSHTLEIYPNAWMKCFGVNSDSEAAEINRSIFERIQAIENHLSRERKRRSKRVMGVRALKEMPIMSAHTPKKNQRKVFVRAADNELRMALIAAFKDFCQTCRDCFLCWLDGQTSVRWPAGAFRPAMRPLANAACIFT
jgi:REP element-mobilizing transposase RayT